MASASMHKKWTGFLLIITALFSPTLLAQESAANYVVIVNSSNETNGSEEQLRLEVKRLFLQQKKNWTNGLAAKPLAPQDESEAYAAFMGAILNMREAQLKQFWRKARQTKGITPTRNVRSANVAKRLVSRHEGAFAILTKDEAVDLPEGVKTLFTF